MVGLTALRDGIRLPLAGWGAGTRRLSALTIAEQNQGQAPVTVVDELERGLEPYRQRTLVERLRGKGSQVFATTHSPFVIAAGAGAGVLVRRSQRRDRSAERKEDRAYSCRRSVRVPIAPGGHCRGRD